MLLYPLILLPITIVGIVFWFDSSLILGSNGLTVLSFWTFVGTALSYGGFAFSLYAALMVRKLSSQYFSNQLLPKIAKQLQIAHKTVVDLQNQKTTDVKSNGFLESITAALGSLDRTYVPGLWQKKRKLKKTVKSLSKYISDVRRPEQNLIEIKYFVELRQNLNTLHLEIKNRIEEGKIK